MTVEIIEDKKIFDQVENLLNIGIALSAEKNHPRLLEMIVTEARRVTSADAGTLYLKEDAGLVFKIIQNDTMGVNQGGAGEAINLPPVPLKPENVSSYAALTGESVNIPDVYTYEGFDFTGPRNYDRMTGYRTRSMLVVPLENHEGEITGVLQLLNSLEPDGSTVRPFPAYYQKVVESLASQAAIALTNARLIRDIENLFNSFVQVMATAIDARTPYNANHTRRVALLSRALAGAVNQTAAGCWAAEHFDDERLDQLTMAGWMHDIGKVATPLSVMDKATRLDGRLELVLQRLDYIAQLEKASSLQQQLDRLTQGQPEKAAAQAALLQEKLAQIKEIRELVVKCNDPANFIDEETEARLRQAAVLTYTDGTGRERPYLTPAELENLCVRRGTLTNGERKIMEDHVAVTGRLLEKIPFIKKLRDVPRFAAMHHETLDGQGYPGGLAGGDIPPEARILALADIYDALTASDRPYKKAMPVDNALRILGFMVRDGKLDAELLEIFKTHRVWEKI